MCRYCCSLADIHRTAGSGMIESALNDQVVLILQGQHIAANGPGFCLQAIVRSGELDQRSLTGHTYAGGHTTPNQLDHIGTIGGVLNAPVILDVVNIIFRGCCINNGGRPAVAAALQGAGRHNTIIAHCFLMVAVQGLHQALQAIRA